MRSRKNEQVTVITVFDRSRSIPLEHQRAGLTFLEEAKTYRESGDQLAMVDVAEAASIATLPNIIDDKTKIPERNTNLTGQQSRLSDGVQMAMAIAPPNTATRILLVSDGNETAGDLKEAARIAAANQIPIDVLPLRYNYEREVIFKHLAAPAKARSGQTISLRFVLSSTFEAYGKLLLNLNGEPVDLTADSAEIGLEVQLKPGTNVYSVSLPVGMQGMHEFEAVFIPDNKDQDRIEQNNRVGAMTYVAGPGHVIVVDKDGVSATPLIDALSRSDIEVQYFPAAEFTDNISKLMDADAVILVNTDNSSFSFAQQEMLTRYVQDLGGGLVMVGGPDSFGAGGWIGSPVAEVLPVDLDPPQKKQMPQGALILIMHACEMPQGNFWGKRVATAAVNALSQQDYVGVLDYGWQQGTAHWVFPFAQAGDKSAVKNAINQMQMGDMPDFGPPMQAAYNKLIDCTAAIKHVIIISDGDPQPAPPALLSQFKQAGITCTGVAVFPHELDPKAYMSLQYIAQMTGGNFYLINDPQKLPQIFIKEAQIVRRSLIIEETFTPRVNFSLSEILKGIGGFQPALDGYVYTGPKGGMAQIVLTSPDNDPILATNQSGLGRTAAFTSSADSRWASDWLKWQNFAQFWEQLVRWVSKPSQSSDCEVFADVLGRDVTLTVEAVDAQGEFVQFSNIIGQTIAPDMSVEPLSLVQVGPGRYRGQFQAQHSGSYIVSLRYGKPDEPGKTHTVQSAVTVPFAPEFRDLTDNSALLTEVSRITGGRVIRPQPDQAELFDRTEVKFPRTPLPLLDYLMLVWLGLFLLDVGVRRIAWDVRAAGRSLARHVQRIGRGRVSDPTLERLKQTRQKLRDQWARQAPEAQASRRYEAARDTAGEDLPLAKTAPKKQRPPLPTAGEKAAEKKEAAPAKKPKAKAAQDARHIQQLLKAKRRAKENEPKD
ncbi:MAG: hypothetical protein AMJ79_01005 [Phycisphaerae bacterium SM23_30]|nr:MAG: hypothetical protein AMJ79_01005 [Phycisphaerae bacterium SM23_30]